MDFLQETSFQLLLDGYKCPMTLSNREEEDESLLSRDNGHGDPQYPQHKDWMCGKVCEASFVSLVLTRDSPLRSPVYPSDSAA